MSIYMCIYSIHKWTSQQADMRILGRQCKKDNPEDKMLSRQRDRPVVASHQCLHLGVLLPGSHARFAPLIELNRSPRYRR